MFKHINITCTDHEQGIGVYSYLQSTVDHQDQNPVLKVLHAYVTPLHIDNNFMQNSRSTDDITYVDIGPNTAARAAHLQTSALFHDDCVQYKEIRHEAPAETPVCGPQTSSQILGNHVRS